MQTPEDQHEYGQDQEQDLLQVFGQRLANILSEQISKRAQIEQRWLEDLRQYHGKYSPQQETELENAKGSKVFVNITRNKTNAAEARLSDMLFPTDDRNWGIKPTPDPALVKLASRDYPAGLGQKLAAKDAIKQAKDAAEAMTRKIDDQLNESNYAPSCRDMLHQGCVLGSGVIKGPFALGRTKQAWVTGEDGVSELVIKSDINAATQYVDVWNFYPDMSASRIEDAEFTFERHFLTPKHLKQLGRNAEHTGFLTDQIRQVLKEGRPSSLAAYNWQTEIRAITGVDDAGEGNRYEMWEYNGPVTLEELQAAGVADLDDDPLQEYHAAVFFIGNRVVKAALHPMDTEDQLYKVFSWEKDSSSIFGFGVPYLMRSPQRVINAAWRMVLDNGGLSTGPQIVADREAITPADGDWTIRPRKLWFKIKTNTPVDEVFAVHHINNNQNELMNIFQTARQLADEETNLPLIAQGEQSSDITKTAQGMSMLMNSANIVLRRAIKNFDDDVTRPHITAYYNWNMMFDDDASIKGDFSVDARGSSVLLAREMQRDALMTLANVAAVNPEFAARTDWGGLYGQLVKHLQVSKDDVLIPDEQIEEQPPQDQGPPPDPIRQSELELKTQQMQLDTEYKYQELTLKREIELARIAANQNLTMAQLEQRLQLEQHKEQNKRDIEAGRLTLEQSKQVLQAENLKQRHDTF